MGFVSDKCKLLFFHIPKTGGASLKKGILDYDPSAHHCEGGYHGMFEEKILEKYSDYYKIIIVRNSYQLLASRYRFAKIRTAKKNNIPIDHLKIAEHQSFFPSFEDWLSSDFIRKYETTNQCKQFINSDNEIIVNQIIRYENLKEDIEKLNEELGTQIKLPSLKHHYLGEYDWKEFYNERMVEKVYEMCKEDIEYFNWHF
jgi:hypothetical protein